MNNSAIREAIFDFIKETFIYDEETAAVVSDQSNLIDDGIVDSFGIHEILAFLEGHFKIEIEDAEVVPENFSSIEALSNFVFSKGQQERGEG